MFPNEFNSGNRAVMTMDGAVGAIRMRVRMRHRSMGMRELLLLLRRHAILMHLLSISGDKVATTANADGGA
jgi:hypothetical protein